MYNEKMSKEELFYLFPGNEYPRHTTRRTTCVTQAFHDKCMQFLVIYFSVFLLVNKSTKSLICILFTVAHVSRLHATCNAIACNCMQCKVQRTTLARRNEGGRNGSGPVCRRRGDEVQAGSTKTHEGVRVTEELYILLMNPVCASD